jgi:hypothetical protein
MRTTYFQFEGKFYQQKEGVAVSSSLSPSVSSIFMEYFEKMALYRTDFNLTIWLRYVDDSFVVWPHGSARLQNFVHRLCSLTPTTQYIMAVENKNMVPFLIVLVIRRSLNLSKNVYR